MSLIVTDTSIQYGSSTTIIVADLTNVSINPNDSVVNTEIIGNETIITVMPTISTLYYIKGYNSFNSIIKLNQTVYVNVTAIYNLVDSNYNTPILLNVYGCSDYTWYPSLYLNQTTGSSVVSTPLKDIKYTIQGKDPFNTISITYITITVNSNLIFTPSNPTVYDGNLLELNVNYSASSSSSINDITYAWKSNLFSGLPANCVDLKYGSTLKLHPYNTIEYAVTAYSNNNILTEGYITINVIPKPMNIIDTDIIPYSLYSYVINRNKTKLQEELIVNKNLSKKIINFYYTTLQSAYRMEWTNKNGISCKINWLTKYQIDNESNEMILSFEQQWRFFQYINLLNRQNVTSNFGYLLNIVNSIYLEKSQKIPLYPIEPGVF